MDGKKILILMKINVTTITNRTKRHGPVSNVPKSEYKVLMFTYWSSYSKNICMNWFSKKKN